MPKGGARKGAGRPQGVHTPHASTLGANEEKAIARSVIREHVRAHIPDIIRAQVENSLGITYMVLRNKDGSYSEATNEAQVKAALAAGGDSFRLYTRQPHQPSASMLLSYAADKPVEPVEIAGKDGGPLVVKWQE